VPLAEGGPCKGMESATESKPPIYIGKGETVV